MSLRIPVFFFLSPDVVSATEEEVQELIGAAYEDPESSSVCTSTSTNFWHQHLTVRLANALKLPGFKFLDQPIAILGAQDASIAASSVTQLLEGLLDGDLLNVASDFGPELESLKDSDILLSLENLQASSTIDDDDGDVESFLTFLVTLRATIESGLGSDQNFVWYRPEP